MTTTLGGNTAISDSIGNIRSLPILAKTSGYTLIVSDIGKCISITTGGITVPSAVFSAGDIICVYNNSSSDQTITQGSGVTMRMVGTTFTGNRTLAQRGFCAIHCTTDPSTFIIAGGGLT